MNIKSRVSKLIAMMVVTSVVITTITIVFLYRTAFEQQRQSLVGIVQSRATVMAAVAQFNVIHSSDVFSGSQEATMSQFKNAHSALRGFGETGEFTLGEKVGEQILFSLSHRHADRNKPIPVPWSSSNAEPMRRALMGSSGTVVGLDYRGKMVLAAYEPVPDLGMGVVAKIDIDEIRKPYITAILWVIGLVGIILALTSRYFFSVTAPLIEQQQLSDYAFNTISEAIVITDPVGNIVNVNPAYLEITGYSRDEVIGSNPSMMKSDRHDAQFYRTMWETLKAKGAWVGEIWDRRKSGEVFPKRLSIAPIKNAANRITFYVGTFVDITEQKESESKLRNLAYYDPLTALPNRLLFNDRLQHAMAHDKREKKKLALLFIDLDEFKQINDTLGHKAGDILLEEVARRLSSCIRKSDTVARLGGDEFTIILSEIEDLHDAVRCAKNLLDALGGTPVQLGSKSVFTGGSIGLSLYPDDATDAETLIKNADTAMYRAKKMGRGNYQFFTHDMNESNLRHLELENALRQAIAKKEFELYYQPKVNLVNGQIRGAEALIRWNRDNGEVVSPAEFIPLAEESDIIIAIGTWVRAEACRQTKEWFDNGLLPPTFSISVNASVREFQKEGFVNATRELLESTQFPPHSLDIEITETMLIDEVDKALHDLQALVMLGVTLSIDDFGTGYSSLQYLKKMPLHTLKIDQSFIRGMEDSPHDKAIVELIIRLADSFELSIVAEGVENQYQRDFLLKQGCHIGQGFLFSPPVPAKEFEKLVKQQA